MRFTALLACFAIILATSSAKAALVTKTGTDSDRIRTTGGSDSRDLYASGNDDTFQSYGIMTFNYSAADFAVATLTDLTNADLQLTFNDRTFSDGTQFELLFTADNFDATYSGLTYDVSAAPSGVLASQFTSLTSLGVYNVGFDMTDGSLGGNAFTYNVNMSAVEAELLGEINSGSDFSILIAAVNDADDITFSGVGNTFDAGDPALSLTAVPEPSSIALLSLSAGVVVLRRRR